MRTFHHSSTSQTLSRIGLGTWPFSDNFIWGKQPTNQSEKVLARAIDGGVNLIDTAPLYGKGHAEEVVGRFLKREGLREEVVIATKCGLKWEGKAVTRDSSVMEIRREIEESFNRLQVNEIDIYQVHWPDETTPIRETAGEMKRLFDQGIIKAIGVSNYSLEQMREWLQYAPLHYLQPPYNLFRRDIEKSIVPFCREHNIGILGYSTLRYGVLSGKYFKGGKPGRGWIYENNDDLIEPNYSVNQQFFQQYSQLTESKGLSMTECSILWAASQPAVASALVGARNSEQIEEILNSMNHTLDDETTEAIEQLLAVRLEALQ